MADHQQPKVVDVHRSYSRKKLPTLPRHISLWARLRRSARRWFRGWWIWELAAAGVSLAATVALVVLLAQADRRQPQAWAVGGMELTLNTLVAAIATVMRTSLLLVVASALNQSAWNWFAAKKSGGDASGQPLEDLEIFSEAAANSWNSVRLLIRTRGRYIASLGALITILSLAFDAFVQQVLTTQTQSQSMVLPESNLSAENILPHVQRYGYNESGNYIDDTFFELETAVINGIIGNNSLLPNAICPTGNCEWPVTPTLGVCSECSNLTSQVLEAAQYTINNVTYYINLPSGFITNPDSLKQVSITLPRFSNENVSTEIWRLDLAFANTNETQAFNTRATIATLSALGIPFPGTRLDNPVSAYNCSFYFCIQGYSATAISGDVSQQQVPTTAEQMFVHWEDEGTSTWWGPDIVPAELNAPSTAIFNVSGMGLLYLGVQLSGILTGSTIYTPSPYSSQVSSCSSELASVFWSASNSLADLTALVQGIADSMTTQIRTADVANVESYYAPVVLVPVTVVRIRWPWLTYPLALILAGTLFLALTMYSTSRREVRPWKGHRIPLLLADIDKTLRVRARGGLTRRTGLDDRLGAVQVSLEFDGIDGVTFRRVHPSSPAHGELLRDGQH
ncbi:hypothetical protein MMC11_008855 [Xylographa trunciseda]|nr:hypothetical protein [Xylographa trunciseda]